MKATYKGSFKFKTGTNLIKEYISVIEFPVSNRLQFFPTVNCAKRHRTKTKANTYGEEIARIISQIDLDSLTCKEQVLRAESIYTEIRETGKTVADIMLNEV